MPTFNGASFGRDAIESQTLDLEMCQMMAHVLATVNSKNGGGQVIRLVPAVKHGQTRSNNASGSREIGIGKSETVNQVGGAQFWGRGRYQG